MTEDQGSLTQACEQSPTRDKLECGWSTPKTRTEGGSKREGGRQAARATEEQLEKDKQELEMREQRKRAEDANRICSIINENAENKGLSLVEAKMEKLMHAQRVGRMALGRQRRQKARPGAVCQGKT